MAGSARIRTHYSWADVARATDDGNPFAQPECTSPFGLLDMAGNVEEWTSDCI